MIVSGLKLGIGVLVDIEILIPADCQINYQVQTRLKYSLASSTSPLVPIRVLPEPHTLAITFQISELTIPLFLSTCYSTRTFLSFLGVQIVCCYLWTTVGSRLEYPTRSMTRDQQLQKNILVSCVPFHSPTCSVDTLAHQLISSRWLEVALLI